MSYSNITSTALTKKKTTTKKTWKNSANKSILENLALSLSKKLFIYENINKNTSSAKPPLAQEKIKCNDTCNKSKLSEKEETSQVKEFTVRKLFHKVGEKSCETVNFENIMEYSFKDKDSVTYPSNICDQESCQQSSKNTDINKQPMVSNNIGNNYADDFKALFKNQKSSRSILEDCLKQEKPEKLNSAKVTMEKSRVKVLGDKQSPPKLIFPKKKCLDLKIPINKTTSSSMSPSNSECNFTFNKNKQNSQKQQLQVNNKNNNTNNNLTLNTSNSRQINAFQYLSFYENKVNSNDCNLQHNESNDCNEESYRTPKKPFNLYGLHNANTLENHQQTKHLLNPSFTILNKKKILRKVVNPFASFFKQTTCGSNLLFEPPSTNKSCCYSTGKKHLNERHKNSKSLSIFLMNKLLKMKTNCALNLNALSTFNVNNSNTKPSLGVEKSRSKHQKALSKDSISILSKTLLQSAKTAFNDNREALVKSKFIINNNNIAITDVNLRERHVSLLNIETLESNSIPKIEQIITNNILNKQNSMEEFNEGKSTDSLKATEKSKSLGSMGVKEVNDNCVDNNTKNNNNNIDNNNNDNNDKTENPRKEEHLESGGIVTIINDNSNAKANSINHFLSDDGFQLLQKSSVAVNIVNIVNNVNIVNHQNHITNNTVKSKFNSNNFKVNSSKEILYVNRNHTTLQHSFQDPKANSGNIISNSRSSKTVLIPSRLPVSINSTFNRIVNIQQSNQHLPPEELKRDKSTKTSKSNNNNKTPLNSRHTNTLADSLKSTQKVPFKVKTPNPNNNFEGGTGGFLSSINQIDVSEIKIDEDINTSFKNTFINKNNASLINSFKQSGGKRLYNNQIPHTQKEDENNDYCRIIITTNGSKNTISYRDTPKARNMSCGHIKSSFYHNYSFTEKAHLPMFKLQSTDSLKYKHSSKKIIENSKFKVRVSEYSCSFDNEKEQKDQLNKAGVIVSPIGVNKSLMNNSRFFNSSWVFDEIINFSDVERLEYCINRLEKLHLEMLRLDIQSTPAVSTNTVVESKTDKDKDKDSKVLDSKSSVMLKQQKQITITSKHDLNIQTILEILSMLDNEELFDVFDNSKTYCEPVNLKENVRYSLFLLVGLIGIYIIMSIANTTKKLSLNCEWFLKSSFFNIKEGFLILDSIFTHILLIGNLREFNKENNSTNLIDVINQINSNYFEKSAKCSNCLFNLCVCCSSLRKRNLTTNIKNKRKAKGLVPEKPQHDPFRAYSIREKYMKFGKNVEKSALNKNVLMATGEEDKRNLLNNNKDNKENPFVNIIFADQGNYNNACNNDNNDNNKHISAFDKEGRLKLTNEPKKDNTLNTEELINNRNLCNQSKTNFSLNSFKNLLLTKTCLAKYSYKKFIGKPSEILLENSSFAILKSTTNNKENYNSELCQDENNNINNNMNNSKNHNMTDFIIYLNKKILGLIKQMIKMIKKGKDIYFENSFLKMINYIIHYINNYQLEGLVEFKETVLNILFMENAVEEPCFKSKMMKKAQPFGFILLNIEKDVEVYEKISLLSILPGNSKEDECLKNQMARGCKELRSKIKHEIGVSDKVLNPYYSAKDINCRNQQKCFAVENNAVEQELPVEPKEQKGKKPSQHKPSQLKTKEGKEKEVLTLSNQYNQTNHCYASENQDTTNKLLKSNVNLACADVVEEEVIIKNTDGKHPQSTFNNLNKIFATRHCKNISNNSNNNNLSLEINLENLEVDLMEKNSEMHLFYLPPMDKVKGKEYTLVLDLDETLVFVVNENNQTFIEIRPFLKEFLAAISSYYEIVIYTGSTKEYADKIIGLFDDGYIDHRLYKQHTLDRKGNFIKDLSRLGREIEKVIIIDNISHNFDKQRENGLQILGFYGDSQDKELLKMKDDLVEIAKYKVEDLRPEIKKVKDRMNKRTQNILLSLLEI